MAQTRVGIAGLLRACHPGPAAVVTLVTLGLGVAAGLTQWQLVLVVGAVLLGQLSIGWSNDWLDARRGWDRGRPDKPVDLGEVGSLAVGIAAAVAAGLCGVMSLALGSLAATVHLVAVASGWAYNWGLKATPASVVPYIVSFGLLPSVVTATKGAGLSPWWATVTGACFGAGVHFANVLPDLAVDAVAGVRGLPQRLGARLSVGMTVALLASGAAVVLLAPPEGDDGVGLVVSGAMVCLILVGAVLGAALRQHYEIAFRLAMATGLVVVGILVLRGASLG